MQRLNRFRQAIPVVALIVLGVATSTVRAQPGAAAPAAETAKPEGASKFLGMRRCALCHNQSETTDPEVTREFCLLTEVAVFRREDKHSRAYELLLTPGGLGQRIGKNLGIDVAQSKACLGCHSGWSSHHDEKPPSFESGVTCEACHGPSEKWDQPHSEPKWRTRTVLEKKALGMNDVRDPLRRAQICYSCHIGNVEQNKVVTHDMYAAGHPPLPGIEIETFIAAMPAHSRKVEEKGDFQHKSEFLAARHPDGAPASPGGLPRTKGVLIGGLMALRESLQLFARQAQADERPEFAMFDCQACHHELRLPAWRQARTSLRRPGRPRLPEWPGVLARIAVSHTAQTDTAAFDQKLRTLAEALDERPFGRGSAVIAAIEGAEGLIPWIDRQAQALSALPIGPTEANQTLQALYALGATAIPDFHSARQITWAIRTIEAELRAPYPKFAPRPEEETLLSRHQREQADIATYFKWRSETWQPATAAAARLLEPLDAALRLTLPAGQKAGVGESLGGFLKSTADYDPNNFRRLLEESARQSRTDKSGNQP